MRGLRVAAAAGLTVLTTACVGAAGDTTDDAAASRSVSTAAIEQTTWSGRSASGVAVHVSPAPDPPVPGPVRFIVAVAPGNKPVSVDLVSPTMPMHGVVRYPVTVTAEAIVAEVEIPMEGDWALYVNFDDGDDTAEILFTVAAADSAVVHHHH